MFHTVRGLNLDCLARCSAGYLLFFALIFGSVGSVNAQTLPAQVTPGGVRPGIENTAPNKELRDLNRKQEPRLLPDSPAEVEPSYDGDEIVITQVKLLGALDRGSVVKRVELEALVDRELAITSTPAPVWTVNRLKRLATKITNYYRSRDFFLTQALLLEQSLDDGIAEITILEGVIGDVKVIGNEHIRSQSIASLFANMKGKPTTRDDLESALFYATDLAGITGRGVLQRGELQGTADLVYTISDDDRHEFYLHGDNYGSEFVGEYRLRADWMINNPLRRGDRLTLSGLTAFNPSNNDYYGFDYQKPHILGNGKPLNWGISGSHNEFSVGGALERFGIQGESDRLDFYMAYPYRRTYDDNRTVAVALSTKSSEVLQNELRTSLDELTIVTLRHLWSRQYQAGGGGGFSLNATYSKGYDDVLGSMPINALESSRLGSSGIKAGGDFDKVNVNLNWSHRLSDRLSLFTRLNGQESSDLLVSLEQFPIGGPNSVRAYPLSSFLMDSGLFASTELSANVSDSIRVSVFGDYAEGDLNESLPSDVDQVDVYGFGIGISASFKGRYSLLATAAQPAGSVPSGIADETQYFISISANFN